MAAPTRAKRQLGACLRDLRTRAEVSAVEAAAEIKASDSTVNRYEAGEVMAAWGTVRTLLGLYGALEEEIERAEQLWEAARDEPPPVRLPTGSTREFRRLVTEEREGETVRTLAPATMPGLLQTEQTMRAINARLERHQSQAKTEGWVAVRLGRQKRLSGPDPLQVHAVLDEAVIRRIVGGKKVMHDQLAHLLELADQPNITLQIVPFAMGAYGTMSGPVTIVGYTEPGATPGVYLEHPAGAAWVDNASDVSRFITMFDDAASASLSPADTADVIRQQMRVLKE